MSESATRSPISLSQDAAPLLKSWTWTDEAALATSNDDYAVCEDLDRDNSTQRLFITGFGSFGIPEGSTILGVQDEIECRGSVDGPVAITASLLVGNVEVGENKAGQSIDLAEVDTTITVGDSADLWNAALTQADVEGDGFGLSFQVKNEGVVNADIYVDHVRRTVWWTPPEEPMANYATQADAAAYMGIEVAALPTDIDRLLTQATHLVDYVTLNQIDITDADHEQAAQDATCAQVEYWINHGEDEEFSAAIKSYQKSKVSVTYAGNPQSIPPKLCERAKRHLLLAGLLYRGVMGS